MTETAKNWFDFGVSYGQTIRRNIEKKDKYIIFISGVFLLPQNILKWPWPISYDLNILMLI